MGTDLIIPEIMLIEKLEETEQTLSPVLYEQLKSEIISYHDDDKHLPVAVRQKKRMLLSDFVNKAISLPLEISPKLTPDAEKQLYRLHIFCCQQAIHNYEVRRNPLVLGFRALEEMHMALTAIFISYRLIHPECPYSWNENFFIKKILTHKGPDGHTIVKFLKPLDETIINKAINEEIITDWLIYRAYDHNGIRTLTDIKNNLIDVPNFQRGGQPTAEFSRFERKMAELRNKKEQHKNEELDLEFRKTLVKAVAEQTVEKMLSSGVSAMDLLQQAYNGDLNALVQGLSNTQQENLLKPENNKENTALSSNKRKILPPKNKQNTEDIENIITGLLEDNT